MNRRQLLIGASTVAIAATLPPSAPTIKPLKVIIGADATAFEEWQRQLLSKIERSMALPYEAICGNIGGHNG